jgi:hypothetical protein
MGATCVDQGTLGISPACIEGDVLDLPLVNASIPPDVVRVREVPAIVKAVALLVIVVSVVTHWLHAIVLACLANAGTVDLRLNLDTNEFISTPLKLANTCPFLWLGTKRLSRLVP